MIRVEMAKWGQTLDHLRLASMRAPHRRTRERFQALYLIASGRFNATTCAAHIGRQDDTVLGWVHRYNADGPDALTYRRTGGRAPLFRRRRSSGSSRSSRRPGRPSTACPATAGPRRSSGSGSSRPSAATPRGTASAASYDRRS